MISHPYVTLNYEQSKVCMKLCVYYFGRCIWFKNFQFISFGNCLKLCCRFRGTFSNSIEKIIPNV